MKMLGNDVLTQEEFDTFHSTEFKPVLQKMSEEINNKFNASEAEALKNQLAFTKKISVISLSAATVSVILVILTKMAII